MPEGVRVRIFKANAIKIESNDVGRKEGPDFSKKIVYTCKRCNIRLFRRVCVQLSTPAVSVALHAFHADRRAAAAIDAAGRSAANP